MKFKINQKLLFEFFSITFAVFLGLLLNQWKDNFNNNRLAEQSQDNILSEILENSNMVKQMLKEHQQSKVKIDSILASIDDLKEQDQIHLDANFQIISSTSWETAKLTKAIAYMDISLVTDIAGVYEFQQYYETLVKDFVMSDIRGSSDKDDLILMRSKAFLDAIIPMETSLIEYYQHLQKEILDHN